MKNPILAMTLVLSFTAAAKASSAGSFEGSYSQKSVSTVKAYPNGQCDDGATYVAGSDVCQFESENTIQIEKDQDHSGKFKVTIVTMSSIGMNFCDGVELSMKSVRKILVPATKIQDASKNYKLAITKTGNVLSVHEHLGSSEIAFNSSPGCGVGAFFGGNGKGYVQQP